LTTGSLRLDERREMRYLEVEGSNPSCGTTITSLILN
jgi:hypothetical protein